MFLCICNCLCAVVDIWNIFSLYCDSLCSPLSVRALKFKSSFHFLIYIILTVMCCYWILIELHSLFHKDQCNGSSHIIAYRVLVGSMLMLKTLLCVPSSSHLMLLLECPLCPFFGPQFYHTLIIPTTFLWGLFFRYESF